MLVQPGLVLVMFTICWKGEGVPWFWESVTVNGSYDVIEDGGEAAVPDAVPLERYGPGNVCPGSV